MKRLLIPCFLLACLRPGGAAALLHIAEAGDARDSATIEIRGVKAGPFDGKMWTEDRLHWVRDVRAPLLQPREGAWRNIYAPSAVPGSEGWRVFYGGWDGAPTGNDRIYATTTTDFLAFGQRHTVIEHGSFHHVCNVNALAAPLGGYEMVCTAWPDGAGLNKPVFFALSEEQIAGFSSGKTRSASPEDIVALNGYEKYPGADINGMNVLLREGERLLLYFGDFRHFGSVYRAAGSGGSSFTLEGSVLPEALAPNDVKKFRTAAQGDWYLMGLHMNSGFLRYALSRDGLRFTPSCELFQSAGDDERFITSLGWVVSGDQEAQGRRLLGVLYGAGAEPTLDRNRIFARWLQKRLVLRPEGGEARKAAGAFGPDRQIFTVAEPFTGKALLYAEDGVTLISESAPVLFRPGKAYIARNAQASGSSAGNSPAGAE